MEINFEDNSVFITRLPNTYTSLLVTIVQKIPSVSLEDVELFYENLNHAFICICSDESYKCFKDQINEGYGSIILYIRKKQSMLPESIGTMESNQRGSRWLGLRNLSLRFRQNSASGSIIRTLLALTLINTPNNNDDELRFEENRYDQNNTAYKKSKDHKRRDRVEKKKHKLHKKCIQANQKPRIYFQPGSY